MRIAVAGTGYVGLSLAVLLARGSEVVAVDVVPAKVEALARWESPIRDAEIEEALAGAASGERPLALSATLDAGEGYRNIDFAVVATPPTTTRRATSSTPRAWRRPWPPSARRAPRRGSS